MNLKLLNESELMRVNIKLLNEHKNIEKTLSY